MKGSQKEKYLCHRRKLTTQVVSFRDPAAKAGRERLHICFEGPAFFKTICQRLALTIIVLCLCFTGCRTSSIPQPLSDPPQIPSSFTCEIQFSMEGLEGTAHLERPGRSEELQNPSMAPLDAESGLELCFSSPDTLTGVTILYLDGTARIQIDGVYADFPTIPGGQDRTLPDGALISVLAKVLRQASVSDSRENWTQPREDEWQFAGNLFGNTDITSAPDTGNFRLTVSDGGLPISLSAENAGISVQFYQVSPAI